MVEEVDDFPEMPEKRCIDCGAKKKIMHITRDRSRADGHCARCRACVSARDRDAKAGSGGRRDAGYGVGWRERLDTVKREGRK